MLHLNENIDAQHPDWESLIGMDFNNANAAVEKVWPYSLFSDVMGFNRHRCVEYQHYRQVARLIIDENDHVLDVFFHYIEY